MICGILPHVKITFLNPDASMVTVYNLVHKFIPMPLAMKISDAKAAVEKPWKMLEVFPA